MRAQAVLLLAFCGLAFGQEDATYFRFKDPNHNKKCVLMAPKDLKKNEALALLVVVPGMGRKAGQEIDLWRVYGYKYRFAVLSAEFATNQQRGWAPSEQVEMERDGEILEGAIEEAKKRVAVDESAIFLYGYSGGAYLALWMGLRRADLFLGVCTAATVFYPDVMPGGKYDKDLDHPRNLRLHMILGKLDHHRSRKESLAAKKLFEKHRYRNFSFREAEKMLHESKPEVTAEWIGAVLKDTKKGRTAAQKVRKEVDKVKAMLAKKPSRRAFVSLSSALQKEKKAGFNCGAAALYKKILGDVSEPLREWKDLEADGQFEDAAAILKKLVETYSPLPFAKEAEASRRKIVKSDGYKAEQLFRKAKALEAKEKEDEMERVLQEILDKYPDTPAGKKAKEILG